MEQELSLVASSVRDMTIGAAEPGHETQWCPLCDLPRTSRCDAEIARLAAELDDRVDERGGLRAVPDGDGGAWAREEQLRAQVAALPTSVVRSWAVGLSADAAPAEVAQALWQIDAGRLDPYAAVALLEAAQQLESFVAAATAKVVVAIGGSRPADDELDDASVCAELAAATRRTSFGARKLLDESRSLVCRLPATTQELERGRITRGHALVLSEAARNLGDEAAAWLEEQVLPTARRSTVGVTRRAATRAALAAEPALAEARARRARAERRVERWRTPGSAEASLVVTGPPEDIETMWASIDSEARSADPVDGDDRPAAARRFDVILGWATGLEIRPGGSPPPRSVAVNVTVDLATLYGLRNSPGELHGYGPIPAGVARRLATEDGAWWQRFVHDPVTGYLLDLGTERYRPSAALRRYLVARDRTSRFPGSCVPASRCDLDHAVPAPDGATSAANMGPLNRTGHVLKTVRRWTVRSSPDGSATWLSPSGRRWKFRPHDHRAQPVRTEPPTPRVAGDGDRASGQRLSTGEAGNRLLGAAPLPAGGSRAFLASQHRRALRRSARRDQLNRRAQRRHRVQRDPPPGTEPP